MRILLLISLFFSFDAFANGDWVDLDNVKNSQAYWSEGECNKKTGNKCGRCQDRRLCMKGQVDDLDKPNFRTIDNSPVKLDCDDFNDCSTKSFNVCLADSSIERWGELVNFPGLMGVSGPWFIWCEKPSGTFKQKDALVVDVAGSSAAGLEDDAKEADILDKKNRRDQCDTDSDSPTMTPKQLSDCIRVLMGN